MIHYEEAKSDTRPAVQTIIFWGWVGRGRTSPQRKLHSQRTQDWCSRPQHTQTACMSCGAVTAVSEIVISSKDMPAQKGIQFVTP